MRSNFTSRRPHKRIQGCKALGDRFCLSSFCLHLPISFMNMEALCSTLVLFVAFSWPTVHPADARKTWTQGSNHRGTDTHSPVGDITPHLYVQKWHRLHKVDCDIGSEWIFIMFAGRVQTIKGFIKPSFSRCHIVSLSDENQVRLENGKKLSYKINLKHCNETRLAPEMIEKWSDQWMV